MILFMTKLCKFNSDRRCYHDSCSLIDLMGNVSVCLLFRGGDMFTARKVGVVLRPLFSKHRKGGR